LSSISTVTMVEVLGPRIKQGGRFLRVPESECSLEILQVGPSRLSYLTKRGKLSSTQNAEEYVIFSHERRKFIE
jgi:hypothetical protein